MEPEDSLITSCLVISGEPLIAEAVTWRVVDDLGAEVTACSTLEEGCLVLVSGSLVLLDADLMTPQFASFVATALDRDATLLVFRGPDRLESFERAFRAGIRGYVTRSATSDELVAAAQEVARGERHVPAHLAAEIAERHVLGLPPAWSMGLTPREREAVVHATEGLTNAQIGARMFISRDTVKEHLKNAYAKLGVNGRAAAAARVAELGLLADWSRERVVLAGAVA